jgi:hypothetical protein
VSCSALGVGCQHWAALKHCTDAHTFTHYFTLIICMCKPCRKYAAVRGWRFEEFDISAAVTDGGYKEASALVSGDDVFSVSGVRVRVPSTRAAPFLLTCSTTLTH